MEGTNRKAVSPYEIANQREYTNRIFNILSKREELTTACVMTYGCQQNENDSEHLKGMLFEMGCTITNHFDKADILVINTCAVRENAEKKIYGVLGSLKHMKHQNPEMILVLCGCMAQQEHVSKRVRASYPQVDILFGTHALYRFPKLLYNFITENKRIFDNKNENGQIAENMPVKRDSTYKAWVSVISGCNNFCTYCIVPYVRGRERSRRFDDILNEAAGLVKDGYRDITLLGQNVNSYGKDLDGGLDFADLIAEIDKIPGDFLIRFMTSHPKDMSEKLIDTMACSEKAAKHLHLPFQSGSDRVLKKMNRGYTVKEYLSRISYAKTKMPALAVTSDVIVGFPGETEDDFEDTLTLVKQVEFDNLFTFLYSKRCGTIAADMPDDLTYEDKLNRFNRLLDCQHEISLNINKALVGNTLRILCEGESRTNNTMLCGRTESNKVVNFKGHAKEGEFTDVYIDNAQTWFLTGKQV